MTENDINPTDALHPPPSASNLRQLAEAKYKTNQIPTDDLYPQPARLSPEETQQMLHELQVHQVELEIQNEELRRSQAELEVSRTRYFDLYDLAPVGYITLSEQGLILEANLTAAILLDMERSALVKQPLRSIIFHEDQDIYYRLHKQLFGTSTRQAGEIRLRRVNADPYWVQMEMTASHDADGTPVCRAVISDITERKKAEKLLRIHAYEQSMLLEISQTLAASLEIQPGLILDQLREIIEYNLSGLFALDDHSLVTLAVRGKPQLEKSPPIHIRLKGQDILEKMFKVNQPVRIDDVFSDDPQALLLRSLLEDEAAIFLEGIQSWMWVPLSVKNRIIGCLGVAHEKPNFFTPHHASLALSVAHKVAITMVNAELNKQAQTLAVLEERQRLARNLHDAINQSLFSAGLITEVLPRLWDRDQAEARQALNDLLHLVRGAKAEMRALLAELRPATLTDSNLSELLQLLGNAFSGRTNIPVVITEMRELIFPPDVQVVFYRVCQEALNNIAKHANASQVEINLNQEGTVIVMIIRDNGQGFNINQTFSGHYGISMMQERARSIGAQLTITSQPGHGSTVTLFWTPPLAGAPPLAKEA